MIEAIQVIIAVLLFIGIGLWTQALNRIYKALDRLDRSSIRIEAAAAVVASDLSSSQARADQIQEGQPGEAADAGAQSEKPNP